MARPVKKRRICSLPENREFRPVNHCQKKEVIKMSLDEYEVIRLIDYEKLNQVEAAKQINVARTTVQGIYSDARAKLAKALVEGKSLVIEGGHYKLCDGQLDKCSKKCKRN